MKRLTTKAEQQYDISYLKTLPIWERILVRLCRKQIMKVSGLAICRAYERSQIDSFQMHQITASISQMVKPENWQGSKRALCNNEGLVG